MSDHVPATAVQRSTPASVAPPGHAGNVRANAPPPHTPAPAASMRQLSRWLLLGEWRAHPVRALVAIAAIAVGISLGFAIHLINAAAFNEFSAAVKGLSGLADVQVRSTEPFFDEAIYPALAQRDGVVVASPVLEFDASVPGQRTALKIIGTDAFRASYISPELVGTPTDNNINDTLADDALFLSAAAQQWLQPRANAVTLQVGTSQIKLRVAGSLPAARAGQRIAVMDIGAAQWRFAKLGQLSRIDLKLRDGVNREAFKAQLEKDLQARYPGRFRVNQPNDGEQNNSNESMSRAYRVNLTVLALVALFTGAFLVFSTQALSVIRRRSQFALLRVLGMDRQRLLRQILLEGLCLGIAGSAIGIAAGYGLAAAALHFMGADLGAGFFSGVRPQVQFTPVAAAVYFALGVAVALLGCAAPALDAARAKPAIALKSGSEEAAMSRLSRAWPSLACIAMAALLSQAPPIFELPLFGYVSIALLLIGAIGLMPRLAAIVFRFAHQRWSAATGGKPDASAVMTLTLSRLANASSQAGIALGGVLSSFSLMVAMAIMVASFRVSLDDWLLHILPADIYVSTASGGATAGLRPQEQAAVAALPGVASADFLTTRSVALAPGRPPVTLMARTVDAANPGRTLAIVGATQLPAAGGPPPVWISEAMVDLYGMKVGQRIELPLAGAPRTFLVAGVWRDYARPTGTIQMRLSDYRAITGEQEASGVALTLKPGSRPEDTIKALKQLPFAAALTASEPSEIRAMSMKIFDRSFAITYLLEAIAIVIGLFGVAATFSAQTLARAKEFGMLRHVGVTRRQVLSILAIEGGSLTALGIVTGFALGWVISLILVFVVNPQSFHWTMQLHMPWPLLATVAGLLLAAAALTALLAGRQALSGGADTRRQGGLVMFIRLLRLVAVTLAFALSLPVYAAAPEFATVTPLPAGAALSFPKDYGAHPEFKTEWWYVTGWLDTPDGKPLGFQVTFFRSATTHDRDNPSQFAPKQLIIGHAAVSDPANGKLLHDQRSAREGFGLSYAKTGDTNVKLEDWHMVRAADGSYTVHVDSAQFKYDIKLTPGQAVMPEDQRGYSRKGPRPGQASYYYSEPHLQVSGNVTRNGKPVAVTGSAWLDHEWFSEYVDPDASGWDWIGANLDDGGALMAFQIRSKTGAKLWAHATWRDASGKITQFAPDQVSFSPQRKWRSPRTNAEYPVATRLTTGGTVWDVVPLQDDQELDSRRSVGAVYWEGAVTLNRDGKRIGRAYLELTGYVSAMKL